MRGLLYTLAFALVFMFSTTTQASPPAEIEDKPVAHNKVSWEMANQCETFRVVYSKKGNINYKRNRQKMTKEERKNTYKLMRLVTREMGVDWLGQQMFSTWMDWASHGNHRVIHILNQDLQAHRGAYRKFDWSKYREKRARETLATKSAQDGEWWKAKEELRRILIYKNNPYYHQSVEYEVVFSNGNTTIDYKPVFQLGYGAFDMNAVYYTKYWSHNAPPWYACAHGGIPQFIVAVWAARDFQKQCGGSAGEISHRYGKGKCGPATKDFRKRANGRKFDPDKRPRLGKKYPKEDTDRGELLDHMIKRAVEEGLLDAPAK